MSNDTQHYTNLEIFHSLVPKLDAISPIDFVALEKDYEAYSPIIDAIATAYRSGYGRGQKGRSFLIGGPKCTERWVPATKDNVKVGSKVRMIDDICYKYNPMWYPPAGTMGTIINAHDIDALIQWPSGITSEDDRWLCTLHHLEVFVCE